jgi:hypothetical protein
MVCAVLSVRHQEEDEKGRCSHQEQRPSPGDFVRESVHSRASAENPVLSQATVVSPRPVGRPTLSRQPFLMLAVKKTISVRYSKLNFLALRRAAQKVID